MSRPALVVHGHFYQPPRADPVTGRTPVDPTAAPARDWNTRIAADCYRPNAVLGNFGAMSWDLGPTLAGWLGSPAPDEGDAIAYRGFVDGDHGTNGMAQPFHHPILPLASPADRRTEIRWGLRDFAWRFGRRPRGMWLPETAVDTDTLRMLADEGIEYTILAPWQIEADWYDTRRPARVELGDGRSMVVAVYDGLLSAALSFEPGSTVDADAFVRHRLAPRFAQDPLPDGVAPIVLLATDGELYGHHQQQREHFLARLVGSAVPADLPYDTPSLAGAIDRAAATVDGGLPVVRLRDGTSWSCHHGVDRWGTGCTCVADAGWKAPLRSALERLAAGVDEATETVASRIAGAPDLWEARDAYVDVVIGATAPEAFAATALASVPSDVDRATLLRALKAQQHRLEMFASCAFFWESPDRVETVNALRSAHHAAQLADELAPGADLTGHLAVDLAPLYGIGG